MSQSVLIKGGTVVALDAANTVVEGDVLVRDGRIEGVGEVSASADLTIDARGCAVLPGFVQTHVHLCQTLFRGSADDLELIDWLKRRVWPLEAAHDAESVRASARLGVAEMIRGGTTCALTMETVNHTEEVFRNYLARLQNIAGEKPLMMRDVLTALIKAYEIQGVLLLENNYPDLGYDYDAGKSQPIPDGVRQRLQDASR